MKTLYIDCGSGLSGDMMLAALLDLGAPAEGLKEGLASLGLDGFHLEIRKKRAEAAGVCGERTEDAGTRGEQTENAGTCGDIGGGIEVTDVDVVLHDEEAARTNPYSGDFRNYGQIRRMIDDSNITSTAKGLAKRIFDIKARAGAKVHGVPLDQVKFHEAGAVDSVVDVVGAAICLDSLHVDRVVSTPVPTGFGTVQCAFGELPVPAPAVREILDTCGMPHYRSHVEQELLTPTGASILAAMVDEFRETLGLPEDSPAGYGLGKRTTGLPPLKVYLAVD